MPVPNPVPLNVIELPTTVASVATGQTAQMSAPFTGRIILVGASTGANPTATADATCTTSVNGVAIPNGAFTVTSGTTAYTATTNGISSGGIVNLGDTITWAFTGTGTGGGITNVFAQLRRGTI
jgi:hypothetical protein